MKKIVIVAVLMATLPAYGLDFPVNELPLEFTYIEYHAGREVGRGQVLEKDQAYVALAGLVSRERQGWRYDFTSYAPRRMYRAPSMNINCTGQLVVVNYNDASRGWIQISKEINSICPAPDRKDS